MQETKEYDDDRMNTMSDNHDMTQPLLLSSSSNDDTNLAIANNNSNSNNNLHHSSVISNIEHFINSTIIIWNEIWNIQSHDEFVSWLQIWLRQLMRRMGNYLAYCTLIMMLILVPVVLYNALSLRKVDTAAINSAYVMVCGTIILSSRLVYLHLTHWYMPEVQKYIVRILWMVPIYAIQSYFSLRFHNSRVYITSIRDFYEAYVIASFVYYLMELLGGQESIIMILQRKDPNVYGKHAYPFRLVLKQWNLGLEFMIQCKYGVLQYVVFKTTLTILIFFCQSIGIYGEGQFTWYVAYPYFCFFQNISVMYALYCLVLFFHVVNDELIAPINWHPLGKFVCVKGVVFFTWWQGVIIFYLKDHNIISSMGSWSSQQVANGLIDYCIVVEMVGFAIAHSYTFTYTEYLPSTMIRHQQQFMQQQQQTQEHQQQQQSHFHEIQNQDDTGSFDQEHHSSAIASPLVAENLPDRLLMSPVHCDNSTSTMINPTNGTMVYSPAQHHPQLSTPSYRPPATLPRPMKFADALWSSTVPRETINDIKRLRVNIDTVIEEANRERSTSTGSQEYGTNHQTNSLSFSNHNINDHLQLEAEHEEQEISFSPNGETSTSDSPMRMITTNMIHPSQDEPDLFPDLLLDLVVDSRPENANKETNQNTRE